MDIDEELDYEEDFEEVDQLMYGSELETSLQHNEDNESNDNLSEDEEDGPQPQEEESEEKVSETEEKSSEEEVEEVIQRKEELKHQKRPEIVERPEVRQKSRNPEVLQKLREPQKAEKQRPVVSHKPEKQRPETLRPEKASSDDVGQNGGQDGGQDGGQSDLAFSKLIAILSSQEESEPVIERPKEPKPQKIPEVLTKPKETQKQRKPEVVERREESQKSKQRPEIQQKAETPQKSEKPKQSEVLKRGEESQKSKQKPEIQQKREAPQKAEKPKQSEVVQKREVLQKPEVLQKLKEPQKLDKRKPEVPPKPAVLQKPEVPPKPSKQSPEETQKFEKTKKTEVIQRVEQQKDSNEDLSSNISQTSVSQSISSTSVTNVQTNINFCPTGSPFIQWVNGVKKTLELDKKYYKSMRIYLTSGKVIGYAEEEFRKVAKRFKLKGDKLFIDNTKEVIETGERQREISVEFHLNPNAKTERQRHRGVVSTAKAIKMKYHWPTIESDVESVINQCRVCNPKEYDLTSHQLWKYIEIGVIDSVLIVRDLNENSSIFICSSLEAMTPINLSNYLMNLFKTYGTPNAIRIVLEKELQKQFTEKLREYLCNGLLEFIKEVEFVSENSTQTETIKLPMVDIKIETDSNKCPKSEKDLLTTFAAITENDDISLFYIFSCDMWLIKDPVFNSIKADIKNFTEKFPNWKSRLSSLTLYFQINGINLKANEVEEVKEETTHRNKRHSQSRELERLESDNKLILPSSYKRQIIETKKKGILAKVIQSDGSSSDSSDDESVTSKRSTNSDKNRRKPIEKSSEKRSHKKVSIKEIPFRNQLREQKERKSIEVVDIDDSSQHSFQSFVGSVVSLSSGRQSPVPSLSQFTESTNSETTGVSQKVDLSLESEKYDPNGICKPCVVFLNNFSQEFIEKAIAGDIHFEQQLKDKSPKERDQSPEIMVSEDSDQNIEGVEDLSIDSNVVPENDSQKSRDDSILAKSVKELEKESKEAVKQVSIDLRLSESDSSSEEETIPEKDIPKNKEKTIQKPIVSQSQSFSDKTVESHSSNKIPAKSQASDTTTAKSQEWIKTPAKSQASDTTTAKSQESIKTPARSQLSDKTPIRSQTRRKRSRITSDDDSDYDYTKDLGFGTKSTKQDKNDKKSKTNSISNEKSTKKVRKISRRLVDSASSDSDSSDNQENQRNNNTIEKKTTIVENKRLTVEVHKCTHCDFQTNERVNLIMHSALHKNKPGKKVLCPECCQVFFSEDLLSRHKREEHPINFQNAILYGCEKCPKFECYSLEEVDKHLMTHIEDLAYLKTSSKYRCRICQGYSSPDINTISKHLTQKHRMYRCAFGCATLAPEFLTLERHAKSIHSDYEKPFDCKYCEYSSAVFGALVQHKLKSHFIEWTNDGREKCCLCETHFEYDDSTSIITHLFTHCAEFEYFECKSCQRRVRSVDQLKHHGTVNHAIGPAEGLEVYIGNIHKLFDDLKERVKERNSKISKSQSTSNEMQNAIAGLMDEQFVADEDMDPVAMALNSAFNEEETQELPNGDQSIEMMFTKDIPTIRIADGGEGDLWGPLQLSEDGDWIPV